jgi:hypothetical protein
LTIFIFWDKVSEDEKDKVWVNWNWVSLGQCHKIFLPVNVGGSIGDVSPNKKLGYR